METGNNPLIDVRSRSSPVGQSARSAQVRVSQILAHAGRDLDAPEMKTQIAEIRTGAGVLRRTRIIGQN